MAAAPPRSNVNVPIRIALGSPGDGERVRDAIANAAGAQLGRALDVLDDRGEWQGRLGRLDVQFTGEAANLPEDRKRELYAYVGDGLARGAEVAQTRRRVRRRRRPRKPPKKPGSPGGKGRLKPVARWRVFSGAGPELATAFQQAASDWMVERAATVFPTTYGILFRLQGRAAVQLWIVHDGAWVSRISVVVPDWSGPTVKHQPRTGEPDRFQLRLELEPDGFDKWRSGAIESASAQRARAEKKGGKVQYQKGGANEAQARHRAEATKIVEAYMRGWETSMSAYYWLRGLGESILIPFVRARSPNLPARSRIELVALVDLVHEAVDAAEEEEGDGGGVLPDLPDPGGGGGGAADQGAGSGAGGLGSDVTAPAGQDVGEGGRGVVIAPEYKKGAPIFPSVPADPDAEAARIVCEPFKDEPSVKEMADNGGPAMEKLIAEIAARLDMAPCEYAANFCIQASRMVRVRASQVQRRFALDASGEFSAELSVGTFDAEGRFRFLGLDSVAVQYLQHLAATVPKIRDLMDLVEAHTYKVTTFAPHHWFEDVMDEGTQACGLIWLAANQIMMQQLLNASRHAVLQRRGNPEYARVFTILCRTHLADQVELLMLRTSLERFMAIAGERSGADAYAHVREHVRMEAALEAWNRRVPVEGRTRILIEQYGHDPDLITRLADATDYVFHRGRAEQVFDAGSIVPRADGPWAIRASDGRLYTRDELDRMIRIRQQVVVSIDPLINQLLNRLVSAVRPLVEHPERIPAFLDQLFSSMLAKNAEVSRKNQDDYEYAFEHAQIHKVNRETPPTMELAQTQVRGFQLSGTHALAHLRVGVRFERDAFYEAAVARLVGQEYYWRSFAEDMVFIFGIAFTIICPPLGAALSFIGSMALGLEAYGKAKEQETIYGSLIDPELVLDYAQIQIDLFMAKLQIALSFLEVVPGAGKAVKALAGLGKRAVAEGVQQGARRGLRKLAKDVVMEELERIARVSGEHFGKALAIELAEEAVEDKVVEALVTPIIEAHIKSIEQELRHEGRR